MPTILYVLCGQEYVQLMEETLKEKEMETAEVKDHIMSNCCQAEVQVLSLKGLDLGWQYN